MASRDIDGVYVNRVIDVMFDNPTASEMGFLVEAYAKIGYYAASAESEAELAEASRKMGQADILLKYKQENPKATAQMVDAYVTLSSAGLQGTEDRARANARKLKNLHESIEQAINAIKFLERNGGVRIG